MKKYKKLLIIFISLYTFIFTGCEDQVLDKSPLDSFSEQDIWNDIELIEKYVWNNYNALGAWGINSEATSRVDLPAAVTDDVFLIFNYGTWPTTTGVLSPSDMGTWAQKWSLNYRYIRNINIFFQNIDEVSGDESKILRLKGDMKFLRAWCYADLVNLFGGVPLITEVFELEDDFQVPRDSYKACVDWIINELNEVKDMVPETVSSNEFGRITKGAALALKSRVLLYAASKLHDPSSNPNGPLFDYDKNNKWQEAADAAKDVINMNYSLVEVNSWMEYQGMFLHNTPEVILARPYSDQFLPFHPAYDYVNSPNGYAGWGGNCPTQGLVDAFQMKDGLSIEESPLYDDDDVNSIYKNKEWRFYANIVYNGCEYRGREVEFFLPGGLDSPDGREGWNYPKTGYTIRKSMDESLNIASDKSTAPLILFRLAEIYLNYAEAQYHLGNEDIAREYVNKIRSRVHLPAISSSGEELYKNIQHEKRIEFALEGSHRFSDTRRWMTAVEELSKDAKGISWRKVNSLGDLDPNGQLVYEIITNQERDFKERMYYLPIPLSEIEKTDLQQNPGY